MIESTGPITRPTPVDPLDLDSWPLACVLAWIIAIDDGFSPAERDEHVRRAYRHEARALPRDMLAAGRKLIDFAAANPERLKLWHPGGVIEDFRLGPEALIFPTLGESGNLTFGLRPHTVIRNADDIGERILAIWCRSQEVRAAWPAQKIETHAHLTVAAKEVCKPPRSRGRKKGTGSFEAVDAPLHVEMRDLLDKGAVVSAEAAARMVADRAHGTSTLDSKTDRLAKGFRGKYPSYTARIISE